MSDKKLSGETKGPLLWDVKNSRARKITYQEVSLYERMALIIKYGPDHYRLNGGIMNTVKRYKRGNF